MAAVLEQTISVQIEPGLYRVLSNGGSGKKHVISYDGNDNLRLVEPQDETNPSQQWRIQRDGSGRGYNIISESAGLIISDSTSSGNALRTGESGDDLDGIWIILVSQEFDDMDGKDLSDCTISWLKSNRQFDVGRGLVKVGNRLIASDQKQWRNSFRLEIVER